MLRASDTNRLLLRRRWLVQGQVQGVGFRPFVYRLARSLRIVGSVRNDALGVTVEAQGDEDQLRRFERSLRHDAPALARIDRMLTADLPVQSEQRSFVIETSRDAAATPAQAQVTPDTAVCPDCLAELRNSHDRRHRYGLTNCTHCGPRFSIVRRVPYDRCNTTMAPFTLCPACDGEYRDPLDRRFHAQPTACPRCGPRVELVNPQGRPIDGDPYREAARLLRDGAVVAIKGLGGFHLAVRCDDARAVARLRQAKHRDAKPFALMAASLREARKLVAIGDLAAREMSSPAAPILLLPRLVELPGVAPASARLGVMLPNTPMQHLLLDELNLTLVMTSGNLSDEPLAIDNEEALRRLGPLCDAILWHNRPIERSVDDSVLLDLGDHLLPIRRSRGYAPGRVTLPIGAGEPGLCVGGELKNTVAAVRHDQAILSQHLGDLKHPLALDYFRKAIQDLVTLFRVEPGWIAHDLHPDYLSTRFAADLSAKRRLPTIPVQHHHAHAASLMAEHGRTAPILAVVCDGTGYGTDGTIWGGELLRADLESFQRVAHLAPIALPGGDAAARDTRRSALALLHHAMGEGFEHHRAARSLLPEESQREMLAAMLRRGVACPLSSGAGRLFDGIAAMLGLAVRNDFQAQAAMALETAARGSDTPHCEKLYRTDGVIDFMPLVLALAQQPSRFTSGQWAALFHEQFAQAWCEVVTRAARSTGLGTVGLTGGTFCNAILTQRMTQLLRESGLEVLTHRLVPCNDGGIALGQAAVAAAQLRCKQPRAREAQPCA